MEYRCKVCGRLSPVGFLRVAPNEPPWLEVAAHEPFEGAREPCRGTGVALVRDKGSLREWKGE